MDSKLHENGVSKTSFVHVEDVDSLSPILENRLPKSGYIYNMMKWHSQYKNEMNFYTLKVEGMKAGDEWIVVTNRREDYDLDICISTPVNPMVNYQIRNAFLKWNIIDWKKKVAMVVSERAVSTFMTEVCLTQGVRLLICPTMFYVAPEPGYYLKNQTPIPPEVEVRSLNCKEGNDFFMETWKYGIEGSDRFIKRILEKNPSIGCFVDGKVVSGVLTYANGLVGMLYTKKEYRNQQLGKICMEKIILELENRGLNTCSTVEVLNSAAIKFHDRLGMKVVGTVDFMLSQKIEW